MELTTWSRAGKCSYVLGEGGRVDKFPPSMQERTVRDIIEPMARDGLRTISLAYKDFVPGPISEPNQARITKICKGYGLFSAQGLTCNLHLQ